MEVFKVHRRWSVWVVMAFSVAASAGTGAFAVRVGVKGGYRDWSVISIVIGLFMLRALLNLGTVVHTIQLNYDRRMVFKKAFGSTTLHISDVEIIKGESRRAYSPRFIRIVHRGGRLSIPDNSEALRLVTTLTTSNPTIRVEGWLTG